MRLPLQKQSKDPNFIGSWLIEDLNVCDGIIAYFESNKEKQRQGAFKGGLDLDTKNSIDLVISPKQILLPENKCFQAYFEHLYSFYHDYTLQWPFLKVLAKEISIGRFNIQRYQKGQHFQRVHAERSGLTSIHRLFAWMTYLNDVSIHDGGSTIFTHYGLEIQPKKGQTLIWPAEWTHAHKGSVLKASSKYIITGWMHFSS